MKQTGQLGFTIQVIKMKEKTLKVGVYKFGRWTVTVSKNENAKGKILRLENDDKEIQEQIIVIDSTSNGWVDRIGKGDLFNNTVTIFQADNLERNLKR